MRKLLLSALAVVLVVVGGFFVLNGYIYKQKQAKEVKVISSYKGTLTGEYICLSHKQTEGPQTLECAFGMKTEAGEFYALDFNALSGEKPNLQTGEKFSASGIITPIEMLSSDYWQRYNIKGIFSVTDSFKKI